MLFDMGIVVMVALSIFIYWTKFGPGAKHKALFNKIDRIRQRRVFTTKGVDMSLRRKNHDTKGIANLLLKPLPDFKRLSDRLERAGKNIGAKQYIFRRLMYCVGITFTIALIFKQPIMLSLAIGIIAGIWVPFKMLSFGIDKQSKAFLRLFPDALDLIVRGLRSGLPVSESLVLVAQEVPDPVGKIFADVGSTMKLGVPMEKALLETAKKLEMTEFNFFTTSIVLQRETGGNLAEILNNLSEVLRGRYIMRMKIKAMSSEARASAYIIGALPFVVILAISIISPKYILPLWNDPRGNTCAMVAAAMMIFGGYVMNKMTKFEI